MSRKATIVSLVPFDIHESKPGLFPGDFNIPACEDISKPTILHIEESFFFVEIDVDRSIQVKIPPGDVAKSIVYDYETSCLEYDRAANAGPGIFYIDNEYSLEEVKRKFKEELQASQEHQHNWFLALVTLADDDWQKTGQHKTISDIQRYAAKSLGLDRPWIIKTLESGIDTIKCIACKSMIEKDAIVCPVCKLILNMDTWKSLQFAGAK